ASLRSLHFLNPYTGWVVGREELVGGGSAGVLLFTQDGGVSWRRAAPNTLPGLNCVRFLDDRTGFVAGDGTEQQPSGLFTTTDGGRTWGPVPGVRGPGWQSAAFLDGKTAVLGGAWSRLGVMREGIVGRADADLLGGRGVRGVTLLGTAGVAVGQGGLLLTCPDVRSAPWRYVDLQVPPDVRSCWDFHAVHCAGDHLWVVGRPGSALLHSRDRGASWEVQITGQPLPLNGVY